MPLQRTCDECGYKTCRICGEDKPADQFNERVSRKGEHGHRNECRGCQSAYRQARYEANKDRWVEANLQRLYGISVEDYDRMYEAQEGRCAICGDEKDGREAGTREDRYERLAVDHNHETGEVRGLLCQPCNRGLGFLRDDPDRLIAAAAYLIRGEG